jgi:hypothetical protein
MTNRTKEVVCLSWGEVCARRLDRHALSVPLQDARPVDIVGTICGAHAQVLSAAELSIGLRLAGITRTAIREALWTERSLIKTFGPRGTVHLLPTQDLPMWTGALSAIPPSHNSQAKDVRLTPEQTEQVVEAIAMALDDAELTIDELSEVVIASTGPWAGDLVMPAFGGMWPRWRQALTTAADRGVLCFGPNRGSKVTYINPRRWLPGFRPADGQIALAALVRRYLHAYGPATPRQFAQWLGTPRRWAMELFDSLSTELQPVEINGTLAWLATGDTIVPPTIPKIILVDKASPFPTSNRAESYTSIILHRVAILWIWLSIICFADDKLMKVRVLPPHDDLEHLMQAKERYLTRNHNASPDRRFNGGKLNMQLIDNIG